MQRVARTHKRVLGLSDQALLDRLAASDPAAFDEIFRGHYADLVVRAERYTHDRSTAEEVAQEVFVELWRRRASLQLQSTLRAYLHAATRNRALNRIRHERVRNRAVPYLQLEGSNRSTTSDRVVEREIDQALRDAVAELPERCREIFELSRLSGLRYAEIADVLGISVKTVETQMGKALRILRERLAPWLPGGDV